MEAAPASWPSTVRALGVATLLALLAAALAVVLYRHNPGWMYDARVYRNGAVAVLQGRDLYRDFPPPAFTYTPFAALLFIPLVPLSVNGIGLVTAAVSILCLEASVWLFLGRPSDRSRLLLCVATCALAVWLDPISLTLLLGQVNIVLMLLVLLDLSLPDGSRWKGLGVGVAAGIKLTPGFFILYLALTRRLRAAATAAAGFGATVALGFAALPGDSIRYWGGTFLDSTRVGLPQNVRTQSLRSLLVRWAHTTHGIEPAWVLLAAAVAVAALAIAWWAHRRGDELLAVCVCGTATLLLSPITWQHHWVWMVPFLLWLARRASRTRSPALAAVAALVAVEFASRPYQWGIPVDPVVDLHLGALQLLQSSTYAVTALLLLVLAAVVTWRRQAAALTFHHTSTPPERTGPRPSTEVR